LIHFYKRKMTEDTEIEDRTQNISVKLIWSFQ